MLTLGCLLLFWPSLSCPNLLGWISPWWGELLECGGRRSLPGFQQGGLADLWDSFCTARSWGCVFHFSSWLHLSRLGNQRSAWTCCCCILCSAQVFPFHFLLDGRKPNSKSSQILPVRCLGMWELPRWAVKIISQSVFLGKAASNFTWSEFPQSAEHTSPITREASLCRALISKPLL